MENGKPTFLSPQLNKRSAFFHPTDAVARGGAQGVQATEQPPWRIRVGLLCNGSRAVTKEDGRTCQTYLCWVIFICVGVTETEGIETVLSSMLSLCYENVQQPVCQTFSHLSRRRQASDLCAGEGVRSKMVTSFDEHFLLLSNSKMVSLKN